MNMKTAPIALFIAYTFISNSIKEAHGAFNVKNIYTWMEPSPSNRFHFYLDPQDPNAAYRFIEIPFGVQFIVYDLAGKNVRSRTSITMYMQDSVNGQGVRNANGYLFTHFDTEARQLYVLGVQLSELVLAKVSTSANCSKLNLREMWSLRAGTVK